MKYEATFYSRKLNHLYRGVMEGEPTRNRSGVWVVSFITQHGTELGRVPLQDVQTYRKLEEGLKS